MLWNERVQLGRGPRKNISIPAEHKLHGVCVFKNKLVQSSVSPRSSETSGHKGPFLLTCFAAQESSEVWSVFDLHNVERVTELGCG